MAATRVEVTLSCGCKRRMPKGTAMQRMNARTEGQCVALPDAHSAARVVEVPGPADLAALLRF